MDEMARSKKLQWLRALEMERMDDSRTVKGIEGRGTEGKKKTKRTTERTEGDVMGGHKTKKYN